MQQQTFRLLGLMLLSAVGVTGCRNEPYYDEYTRSQPKADDLVGTYVLTQQTLNERAVKDLQAENGTRASVSKITLQADGTFSAVNIPAWAKGEIHDRSITKFKSGYGKWSLRSTEAASNDKTILWYLSFASSNIDFDTLYPNLTGNAPSYSIVLNYAEDPDQDEAMTFQKTK